MKKQQIAVYLDPDKKARLEQIAEERGMSASTFVRGMVLDELQKREKPPEDRLVGA